MAKKRSPRIGEIDPRNVTAVTGARVPRQPPYPLVNEGPDVEGMRVILAPITGVTDKDIMRGVDGKPHSFRFQMPPTDSFTRSMAHSHADYDTLRLGQHSRPQGKVLETVRFSTLMVDWDATFAVWPNTAKLDALYGQQPSTFRDEIWNVLNMTDQLEEILNSGTPVKLYAGQPVLWEGGGGESGWDVNMPVTLRTLTVEERAGEPDARYVDVEFVEYRSVKLNRRRLGKKAPTPKRSALRPAVVEIQADSRIFDVGTEKLIAGVGRGTLYQLGKYFWGDPGSGARKIYRANLQVFGNRAVGGSELLGGFCRALYGGHPYKLRIPYGPSTIEAENSYLNPNTSDYLSIIPEESL